MNQVSNVILRHRPLGLGLAAFVACSGCMANGNAATSSLDRDVGGGRPAYQPMLVVPLPSMQVAPPAGRAMDALQARRTPVGDVLLAMFKDSDINLLVDPQVQAAECTFDIKRSTVEEAFEALLASLDLGYEWDGSFLRVRETVRETLHVDIMSAPNTGGGGTRGGNAGGSGGGNSSGGNGGSSGASGASSPGFWEELQGALPRLLGEDARFVVNRSASAVHVEARPSGVQRLREMVGAATRSANKQVSLEARILEVRLDDRHNLGVNWSVLPKVFHSNKTGLAGAGAVIGQTAASGGSAFKFGVLDTNDFSLFVDALQSQGQVRVLSSPRISTMNNRSASIDITDQVPFITRDVITGTGVTNTQYGIEFAEVGVVLRVLPMIGEDGILSVAVTPQVREQTGTVVTPDGLVSAPIISQREATTLVRVADGQAIALGGLRSTRKDETRSGIPFLMNIPWLGQLFSSTVQSRTEVELMILLTPRVLDDTWIDEEVRRGAHRLVQLRRGFQWNSIGMERFRREDWQGGSLQGQAMAAKEPEVRIPDGTSAPLPPDRGLTVTRQGLAAHLLGRAQVELDAGQVAQAIATVERAIELEPTQVVALVAGGVLHARQGNHTRARQLLDRALGLAGDHVAALMARGAVELDVGSAYAAKRYMQRAHDLAQDSFTAANLAGAMLALGDAEGARDLLRSAGAPGAPPELHCNLAFAELATGHVVEARESLNRALVAGADARNPRVAALQALVEEGEGKLRKELEHGLARR
jgi:MSHA biogenesis protein MshL